VRPSRPTRELRETTERVTSDEAPPSFVSWDEGTDEADLVVPAPDIDCDDGADSERDLSADEREALETLAFLRSADRVRRSCEADEREKKRMAEVNELADLLTRICRSLPRHHSSRVERRLAGRGAHALADAMGVDFTLDAMAAMVSGRSPTWLCTVMQAVENLWQDFDPGREWLCDTSKLEAEANERCREVTGCETAGVSNGLTFTKEDECAIDWELTTCFDPCTGTRICIQDVEGSDTTSNNDDDGNRFNPENPWHVSGRWP
jgi:hypothetical protein